VRRRDRDGDVDGTCLADGSTTWLEPRRVARNDLTAHAAVNAAASGEVGDGASDEALVRAARAGDRAAFDTLVERHQRLVYGVCYRLLGNRDDAADAAQDTFLRAFRSLRGFRGHSSFTTWLYRVAVNASLNRSGARGPRQEPIERADQVPARGESPLAGLEREERAAAVRAAVARLPRRQRLTLVLRVYHDLSHEEIARVLGRSVGTVKANLFFALRNLKSRLHRGEGHESTPDA
jgi:RNA polymerase sigma-70 factor (ECF subfamily)